jgi:antitoxin component YwqK of YwqJK toxin-antitoxin module
MVFMPNGLNKVYTESAEIWMDGHFMNGQLYTGKVFVYDHDGVLLKVRLYKNGIYESDGVL